MPGDGRGSALALGAGHAQDLSRVLFGEPQAEAAHHRDAQPGQAGGLGPVAAQARCLDHHVAVLEGGEPAVAGGEHAGLAGRSSTRTGSTPRDCSLRRLAWPSRPRPQTPTRAPGRSDQESFGRGLGHRYLAGMKFSPTGRSMAAASASAGASGQPATSAARSCSSRSPARSSRRAASRTAARHSLTSPTHSNGLAPAPSRARNLPASSGSASGSAVWVKILLSASAGRNGARIRSMKQHLSHCPHQWSRRRAGSA